MVDDPQNGMSSEPMHNRLVENAYRNRTYTLDALRERTIEQFLTETSGRNDLLSEYQDEKSRRKAIREAADYVMATEYVSLSVDEKRWLINQAHDDIFHLGPLSAAIKDSSLTEVSISNWREISVRVGFGDLQPYDPVFDTSDHFEQLLTYALAPLGIVIDGSDPFLEVGLTLGNRIVRLSLTGPPVMPSYNGLVRLHPTEPYTFETLAQSYPPLVQDFLANIIAKGYGLAIIGDGGMGKTTLLGNLLQFAPDNTAIVQRAAEVHPSLIPDAMQVFNSYQIEVTATTAFEDQITKAVLSEPLVLFVDEIQGDEEKTFGPLLLETDIQTLITFRGRANPRRLHSAMSMAVRKSDKSMPQEKINQALLERLPFLVLLSQPAPHMSPRLQAISQWTVFGEAMGIEPLISWGAEDSEPVRTDVESRLPL